jgi:hypothetical protein
LALLIPVSICHSQNIEWHGLLDVRATDAGGERSYLAGGMGKSRYDDSTGAVTIGQAVLRGDVDLLDTLTASAVLSADQQHNGVVDVREIWLGWNPVPTGPWKTRAKAGYFFPPTSVEIDYDSIGWTPTRTISSSAINSWIGEELRTNGVELGMTRLGRLVGESYDIGFVAALFNGNDPVGTVMAWTGWSISDRIAGRNEALQLPDLPTYRADGPIPRQDRTVHPFRNIDGRLGYYLGLNYRREDWLDLAVLHYDNRADPLVVKEGQYGWHTRFDHISAVLRPAGSWELLLQALRGDTLMGANAVALNFRSWYALASHPIGPGRAALRYDVFRVSEHDIFPSDPNSESGHALALSYNVPLSDRLTFVSELLYIDSRRAARSLIGDYPHQVERSITNSLRLQF